MAARSYLVAGAFAAGILAADRLRPEFPEALAAGVAGAILIALAWLRHRLMGDPEPTELLPRLAALAAALVILGAGAVGFSAMGMRAAAVAQAVSPALDGERVFVEGKVISDPEPSGRATSLRVLATSVEDSPTRERLYVSSYGEPPQLDLGDRVRMEGELRGLDPYDPFDAHLRHRRVVARLTVSASEVELVASSSNPLLRAAEALRTRMEGYALESGDRGAAGLVLGLTIGDERLIPREVDEDFRTTSLSHLTAVSGANVAMVLGAVILLLRALGVSRRVQIVCGIVAVIFFGVVTRWEPSVLRACVMAVVALAAYLFGRRNNSLGGLALAFTGLLAFDPYLLWSVGFQLSFVATLGILVITPRLLERIQRWPRGLAEAFAVGVAAQVAVTPLLAFHFERISPSSIPANLAAFPLVAPITVLGLVGGVAGLAVPAAGELIFNGAALIARALRAIASFFASLPFSSLAVEDFGPGAMVLSWLLVATWAVWLSGQKRAAKLGAGVAVAAAVLIAVVPPAVSLPPSGSLRLTFFDVGQGDSALVESPGGARVLIDGGPDDSQVARLLAERGIGRVDLVVLTHPHADHLRGLGEVLRRHRVREALGPGVDAPLVEGLDLEGVFQPVNTGERLLLGDLELEVLGPDAGLLNVARGGATRGAEEAEGTPLNDASVVLRVRWGEECALFTGDIEEAAQEILVEDHADRIVCTVLKAPHHGSARLVAAFVHRVDPEWIVISVGRNDYGHPSRRALTIYEEAGAEVLRTDRLGNVSLEMFEGGGLSVGAGR